MQPIENSQVIENFITTSEVMDLLKISRTKIWCLIQKENFPAFKLGGDYRFQKSEIIQWMEQCRVYGKQQPNNSGE